MNTMMDTFWSFFETMQGGSDETATEVLWKVHNFSFCHLQNGQKIDSPVFNLGKESECSFELYPKGETEASAMDVHLVKHRLSHYTPTVLFLSIASAKDALWEPPVRRDDDEAIAAALTVKKHKCKNADTLTLGDTLTIRCVMRHPCDAGHTNPKNILLRSSFSVKSFCSTIEVRNFHQKKYRKAYDHGKESLPYLRILQDVFTSYLRVSDCKDAIEVHISPYRISYNYYVTCKVLVIDSDGIPLNLLQNGHLFTKNTEDDWISSHPFNAAFISANRELYLPDDNFSCMVELTYTDQVCTEEIGYGHKSFKSKIKDSSSMFGSMKSDIQLLFEDKISCDVHLKIGSESVSVHKSILRARSSVFKAMMDHDSVEKATNTVVIPDMDMETLQHMVEFMYTDTVKGLNWSNALHLYYAADKYDISLLRRRCAEHLVENMNQSNIYEVLVLCDMHNDEFLKKCARNFIFTQKSTLVNSEEWKTIERNYPNLAIEMLRELYCKSVVPEVQDTDSKGVLKRIQKEVTLERNQFF